MNTFNVSFNDKGHQGQFVAVLAHEVRNPLANILLSADTLLSMVEDNNITDYLNIIKRNTVRINNLIIQLLTDNYITETDTRECPINKLLDDVLNTVGDTIQLKKITVVKDYALNDYMIFLNVPRMKIALNNIIINAIEAMPEQGGILTLATKLVYGKYIIEIRDNGCGISKTNLDRMFKVSFTGKPGGLGLGLAIIYDILRLNHVEINVESEVGQGAAFSLLFDKNKHTAKNYSAPA